VVRIHGSWLINGQIMEMDSMPDYNLRVFQEVDAIKSADGVTAPCLDDLYRVRKFYGFTLPNTNVIPNPFLEVPKKSGNLILQESHLFWRLQDLTYTRVVIWL
jgi:hypothetical protein